MDKLISEIQEIIFSIDPELLPLFNIMEKEARFGRTYIGDDLSKLKSGARILEVGSGITLLSCQLAKEGFSVAALEPLCNGFSAFSTLQKIVFSYAKNNNLPLEIIPIPIEKLDRKKEFDFAFSINVMEHVGDIALTLKAVRQAILPGANYRFICANYFFPYEHHFNIPILLSKSLTKRIFCHRILSNNRMDNPLGVWDSLNWITVPAVRKIVKKLPDTSITFNTGTFEKILLRVVNDPEFSARRSALVKILVHATVTLGLHRLTRWIPETIQPIMDCTLISHNLSKSSLSFQNIDS